MTRLLHDNVYTAMLVVAVGAVFSGASGKFSVKLVVAPGPGYGEVGKMALVNGAKGVEVVQV